MAGSTIRKVVGGSAAPLLCAAVLCLGAASAQAQYYSSTERTGRWEVAVGPRYQDYGSFQFRGASQLDVDDSVGFGVSVAYNFDRHLSLGFELFGDSVDYDGTFFTDGPAEDEVSVSGELDTSSGQFVATWHFLEGPITPFIGAGMGWTYIDSNVISHYDGFECWDSAWWGYTCSAEYDTYDDTMFSYSAAVGVRWDITRMVFARGTIGKQWLDVDRAGTVDTDVGRIEVGVMF